ncbi:ABC transporter substrate-binding protein [Rhodococcus sp. SORGH_AS_0301]|uniref:ABC transporter substrate-binding protein n=1 Tax=Rhodococcus sp. SORGH_AS_0301 TaxID=3041780 RepID=UPI0027D8322A|nr:ABC transporter substrate-binding protein [Rhodococcus sp. SORGH_AS_0301]
MSDRSRRHARSVVALATIPAMLALSACGDTSSDDASTIVRTTTNVAGAGVVGIERDTAGLCALPQPIDSVGQQGDTRLVVGSGRATTVPADPQRVVVLTMTALDASCAVGTWERVVGAPTAPLAPTAPPSGLLRPDYLGTGIAEIAGVGPEGSPDVDAIRALAPDVIIGGDALDPAVTAQLDGIAPTVLTRASSSWLERSTLAAAAMGRRDAATRATEQYRARAETVGREQNSRITEASLVRFGADGTQLLGDDSFAGQVLAQAGVRRPGPQLGETRALPQDDLSDAEGDLIYVMFDGQAGLERGTEVMDSDAWKDLGAATDSRVFSVDDTVWSGEGLVAAGAILTDVSNTLNGYV